MASTYARIETRIQQAIEHVRKNPDAKQTEVAREYNVPYLSNVGW
jgi:hypothetical protein